MGTARALLSFYGVPGSATVGEKKNRGIWPRNWTKNTHRWHDRSGVKKVVDRRVQINVLAMLGEKTSPRRKKLQKHMFIKIIPLKP
jgi:hypothetical protein